MLGALVRVNAGMLRDGMYRIRGKWRECVARS